MTTRHGKGRGRQRQVRTYPNHTNPPQAGCRLMVPCTKGTNVLLCWCLINGALDPYPRRPTILVQFPQAQSYQGIPRFPGFPCKNSKFNWLWNQKCEGTREAWKEMSFQFGVSLKWSPRQLYWRWLKRFLGIKQIIFSNDQIVCWTWVMKW